MARADGQVPGLTDPRQRDRFWAQVAAFGAMWGAVEITLGSFLNALRFPFCGALLASLGAALLVAQRQLLPARGASLAVGVVAALCKSISPGGIVLGPMVAILAEAAIVELVLLASPRSALCAALAGGLAAAYTVLQHVVSKYIFYGGQVLELYWAALRFLAGGLGMPAEGGVWLVAGLVGLLAALGAGGGLVGWRLGRDAARRLAELGPAAAPVPEVVDGHA